MSGASGVGGRTAFVSNKQAQVITEHIILVLHAPSATWRLAHSAARAFLIRHHQTSHS